MNSSWIYTVIANAGHRFFLLVVCSFFLLHINLNAQGQPPLRYVGSSTIGNFIEDARVDYGKSGFDINTEPESAGGEQAILEGRADLAGVANVPSSETLGKGVVSTLVGWDAIAVIVHDSNPVKNLTQSQLKGIFTGSITNWNEVGGPNLSIQPFIVSNESATRKVFRSVILGQSDYAGCEVVNPDVEILERVRNNPGAIGHISFSFLGNESQVKKISVNGQSLSLTNAAYPITRPLYLLWWPGRREVSDFASWVLSTEGQRIVMKRFIGVREASASINQKTGTLVVFTETYPVEDGGTFYYPHRPYEVLTTDRELVARVSNHLSINDESPARVPLSPGTYLIRPESASGTQKEFFVAIEPQKLTKLNVGNILRTDSQSGLPAVNNHWDEGDRIAAELAQLDKFKALQPYGDFRLRAAQDLAPSSDRFRMRFRLRAGFGAKVAPGMKVDFRFISSDNPDDPNSPYSDFSSGFNNVNLVIDRAYFHLNPQKLSNLKLWLGKFPNPFTNSGVYSELSWDADLNPEGGAVAFDFPNIGKMNKLALVNGVYLLSHIRSGAEKTVLNASQATLGIPLSKNFNLTASSSFYYFNNIKGRNISTTVFDNNAGNATFEELHVGGSDTTFTTHYTSDFHTLDNFLLLNVKSLPHLLTLKGQLFYNFGATDKNTGYAAGFSYGDLNRPGNWRLYYQFQHLQQDAVFSPFVQDDFRRQTNFTGQVFGLAYAFHKKVSLHVWGLFDSAVSGGGENHSRFRLDLNVKL